MKITIYIAFILFTISCGTVHSEKMDVYQDVQTDNNPLTEVDSQEENNNTIDEEFSDIATYYIVCLDSGFQYHPLNQSMYKNEKEYGVTIDTAGRSYNEQKDLIALADDDEDEMYAGEYFPRRYPSTHLSLEYLYYYDDNLNDKTIGLIAGIYETKSEADSLLNIYKPTNSNAFVLRGEVYVGCMH